MAGPKRETPESVLKSISIFSGLGKSDLAMVYGLMRRRECAKGETLFVEGDRGDELYVVLHGTVAILVVLSDGKELVISQAAEGSFFGEMSIIERAPRSATCRASEDSILLSLGASDLDAMISERPAIAVRIMRRMLAITAGRLLNTSSFVSQMVQWGETARKRAVTDEATGLFNRRFMDDSIESIFSRAKAQNKPFAMGMFDLDHFGNLNKTYGQEFGDHVIVAVSGLFRAAYRESDILVRYGGDEFTFLFPDTDAKTAHELASGLCAAIRAYRFPEHEELRVSASIGIAAFPEHAGTLEELKVAADHALYRAKESGRDRAETP
jgi:diguanylate cyclase (GGDEF)-like protein